MNNLFETSENIEHNQEIIDSIFVFSKLNNNDFLLNINNQNASIHFVDINSSLFRSELPMLKKHFIHGADNKLIIAAINNIDSLKNFTYQNKINFPIYYVNNSLIPLKHKELIFPYTIEIEDGKIKKSYIGKIKID
jgi:hypothetical protein